VETSKIGKHEVKLYDDIDETLMPRYSKFNKYMILNDEVGSSFEAVDKHFSKMYALLNDPVKLKQQIDNFRQLMFSVDQEQSFQNMAYGCLVYSIDGEQRNDLTVSGINETLKLLQFLKQKDVKKKSRNLRIRRMMTLKHWIGIFSTTKTGLTTSTS
jgi:hypothetical protein